MSLRRALSLVSGLALLGTSASAFASADHYGLGDGHSGALNVAAPNTVVNAYTALTADAPAAQAVLTVGSGAAFVVGDLVLVWQAGGFAATSGDQTAVDLTASPVGRFELGRIAATTATTLTLTEALVNAYAGGATQVVRVPEYSTVGVSATGGITAPAWDGSVGGIVAFLATGAVTNDGTIDVSAKGFRGGVLVNNTTFFGCVAFDGNPSVGFAAKGEGIDLTHYGATFGGRGNLAQGAGGGDCHNGGGGGGGNGGLGGQGGLTWPGAGDNGGSRNVGGLGGAALTFSLLSHSTFGGGGGAGDENNGVGTAGKAGGGIVFVRGLSLAGAGAVLADGGSHTVRAGNDGAGGGGAGGSIVLRFNQATACGGLSARGGTGGDAGNDSGQADGTGGGGGGGRVLLQAASSTCTPTVLAGLAGTQNDPTWAGGPFRNAGPTTTNDPLALGIIETAPVGGFPLLSVALTAPTNGSLTDQPKPLITGTCAPDGDPVDVVVDAAVLGTVPCTNGAFSFTPPANLTVGAHTVSATLRDPNNQLSSDPTPTNGFTIVECVTSAVCSGQKPVCDTSAHVCVQCLQNNECAGPTPICDAASKSCRPCSSANANADCNGNGVCAEGPSDPQKGRCVQCTSNPQCTAPAICNANTDTCVGCLVDAQCSNPKPVCGQGQTCTGCTWDADCAGRPATPACLVQSGSCVECTATNATACRGTTPVCDATKNKCVGCNSNGDCGAGTTCINQQCVGNGNDAGPVNPDAGNEDGGVDAGAPNPNDVAVEGGGLGCSAAGGGSLASGWPILGGLALALAGLRRRRRS